MKKITLFLLFAFVSFAAWAEKVSQAEALKAAMPYMNNVQAAASQRQARAGSVDQPVYIFSRGAGEGFVIVSGDNSLPLVLGVADSGDWVEEEMPPLLLQWVKMYEHYVDSVQANGGAPARAARASVYPKSISPLLTSHWHQSAPYNNRCPQRADGGGRAVTGCVATAMSEVMYYYKHPARGTGSHTYSDVKGCKETLTADFSTHTYEWDYMLDSYAGVNYSARQAQAVALLASDCGISVEMQYGVEASGAESVRQPYALFNYFGYDPGMRMVYRDFYHRSELHAMIRNELAASRPVLCSAHDSGGGHAFVIDGYDNQGLYHINWGWGGWCNGYYNIDSDPLLSNNLLPQDFPSFHRHLRHAQAIIQSYMQRMTTNQLVPQSQ